jgi:hypothetical protein
MGVAMLVALPLAAHFGGLPRAAVVTDLVVGGLLVVLGVVARTSAGGFARGRSVAAAEAALRQLESGRDDGDNGDDGDDGTDRTDRETTLRAATLLLAHAYAMYGPKATASFDFTAGRRRLGERLALVEAVEEELLRDRRIDPVFTGEDPEVG